MAEFKERTFTNNVLKGWERTDVKNSVAVVFVHGYTGSLEETWKSPDATKSFPELILALAEFDVFSFGYKTKLIRGGPRIDNIARQLEAQITDHLKRYQIVLLAHSMGGLVCMQYIVNQLRDGKSPPIVGLLMYGTPTTGVEWVRLAKLLPEVAGFKLPLLAKLKPMRFNKQLAEMEPHNVFLENLFGEWIRRVVNGGYPDLPTNTRAWLPVRVVSGNEDWVVQEHSAKGVYAGIDWQNVDSDHRGLVKPLDDRDPRYHHAASFLEHVKEWKPADVLAGLRAHSDWVWGLHKQKLIRDWTFKVDFHPPCPSGTAQGFGLDGFSVMEVAECSYGLRLSDRPFYFGLALGKDTAKATRQRNIAYIHGIYLNELPPDISKNVAHSVRDRLKDAAQAWASLFRDPKLRIREATSQDWQELVPGTPEIQGDTILASYSIPEAAKYLVGRDIILDVSFKSLRPDSIRVFTMEFPWLCYGCNNEVTVYDGELSVSQHELAAESLEVRLDNTLGKVFVQSKDLILPGSLVQLQWEYSERRKTRHERSW